MVRHNKFMMKKSQRLAVAGVIPLIIVVGLSAVVWTGFLVSAQPRNGVQGSTASAAYFYSDNGLTCTIPVSYRSASVANLVDQVTKDSKFLNMANNSPFVFGNAENITGISVTTGGKLLTGPTQNGSVIGGTTVHLPNVLEMVFYSYGASTTCEDTGVTLGSTASVNTIVVQVPSQPGGFNMTAATFSFNAANWG